MDTNTYSPLRNYVYVDTTPARVIVSTALSLRANPPTSKPPLIPRPHSVPVYGHSSTSPGVNGDNNNNNNKLQFSPELDFKEDRELLELKQRYNVLKMGGRPKTCSSRFLGNWSDDSHDGEFTSPAKNNNNNNNNNNISPISDQTNKSRSEDRHWCASIYTSKPYISPQSTAGWDPENETGEVKNLISKYNETARRISIRNNLISRAQKEEIDIKRNNKMVILPPKSNLMLAKDTEVIARAAKVEEKMKMYTRHNYFNTTNINFRKINSSDRFGSISMSIDGDPITTPTRRHERQRRRLSSAKITDSTAAIISQFNNQHNIVIAFPCNDCVEDERDGDVLRHKSILKRDLFDSAFSRRDQVGVISGAPYFRMIPRFNIGGVAQAHYFGIRAALNQVRKVYKSGPVVWITLREEPIIYVNGRSYIIRNSDNPTQPISIVGITGQRISNMEKKLREEILKEAEKNGGNVAIHKETSSGTVGLLWEAIEEDSVQTLEDMFSSLNKDDYNVHYMRLPVTQRIGPTPSDFQFIMNLCLKYSHAPIIYNCQTGRGRSTMMMVISTIVKFYQFCDRNIDVDGTLLNDGGKGDSYRTLTKLVSLLPDGHIHERRVAVLSELSDTIYSITDHVHAAFKLSNISDIALLRLRQYAYLICFSCFCEARLWKKSFFDDFSSWLDTFPEVRTLLTNIVHQPKFQAHIERIATPAGEDAEVARAIRKRKGQVLGSNMILRSHPTEVNDVATTTIPGVLAMRQLCPDVPIFTCGRTSTEGRNELLYSIRINFPQISSIHWISARDEPMIFINNVGYSLLDYSCLNVNNRESMLHISGSVIEELEEKLHRDVLAEATANNGYIIVHSTDCNNKTTAMNLLVKEVSTPISIMAKFHQENDIRYVRMSMPVDWMASPQDFDALLHHISSVVDGDEAIVINDTDGRMRTTLIMNFITAIRAQKVGSLRSMRTVQDLTTALRGDANAGTVIATHGQCYYGEEEAEKYVNHPLVELQVASSICQMLAAGSLIQTVQAIVLLGGRGYEWNIIDAVEVAKEDAYKATGDAKAQKLHLALNNARKYLMILLCVLYLDDQGGYNANYPFSEWCRNLKEIDNILARFEDRPQYSLKFIDRANIMARHSANRAVDRRSGDVLTANYCMKADHFPGCQKKEIRPVICGGPNFRKVDNINVYGCAIPTKNGIHNILRVLGAIDYDVTCYAGDDNDPDMYLGYAVPGIFSPNNDLMKGSPCPKRGRVIWINLREEPIIYVGDKPFVFRDLTLPYVNVELTGIESSKVEHVERKLKNDILVEAKRYEGYFLVHDEDKPGELVGFWEEANTLTVKTVQEVYQDLATGGARVKFYRTPVTDEQSPDIKDFTCLVDQILPEVVALSTGFVGDETVSFVFNCQMGRGRTTSGMVVCCLLIMLVIPDYFESLRNKYPDIYKNNTRYANGDYYCINQLRTVLSDGKGAKLRVDLVLEACNKMQNLRSAIEILKKEVESVDVTEEARARAHYHGVHYLQRYFNIIAFASYLQEEFDVKEKKMAVSFDEWMTSRPEVMNMHDQAQLE